MKIILNYNTLLTNKHPQVVVVVIIVFQQKTFNFYFILYHRTKKNILILPRNIDFISLNYK